MWFLLEIKVNPRVSWFDLSRLLDSLSPKWMNVCWRLFKFSTFTTHSLDNVMIAGVHSSSCYLFTVKLFNLENNDNLTLTLCHNVAYWRVSMQRFTMVHDVPVSRKAWLGWITMLNPRFVPWCVHPIEQCFHLLRLYSSVWFDVWKPTFEGYLSFWL